MTKRQKTYLAGLNFRKMKKVLKQRADDGTLEVVSAMKMTIKFSDEIAHWSDMGYWESVKFTEFWLKLNGRLAQKRYKERYGFGAVHVAFYSPKQQEEEETKMQEGLYDIYRCRWLIVGEQAIMIRPTMTIWNVVRPDRFRTYPQVLVQDVMNIMEDCARHCGGTVEISVSEPQRLPFDGGTWRTFVKGKKQK